MNLKDDYFLTLIDELKEKTNLKTIIKVENGIQLKIHDYFIIDYDGINTLINGKYYYDIEEQDLVDCYYDFFNDDSIVYVQYKKCEFNIISLFSYFKEIKKKRFNLEKILKNKNVEMIFDNKRVIYNYQFDENKYYEIEKNDDIPKNAIEVIFDDENMARLVLLELGKNLLSFNIEKYCLFDNREKSFIHKNGYWETLKYNSIYQNIEEMKKDALIEFYKTFNNKKAMFVYNVKYLVSRGDEPEINLIDNMNNEFFIVAYSDFVDLWINNEKYKLNSIEEIFSYIHNPIVSFTDDFGLDLSTDIRKELEIWIGNKF